MAKPAPPVPGALSDLRVEGRSVAGTLTVTSGQDVSRLLGTAVTVTVGAQQAVGALAPWQAGERRLMLVIDTSGSMGAGRMRAVSDAVDRLLTRLPADAQVGVVSFGSSAGVDLAPTADRARVRAVVRGLRARGETALHDAIGVALKALGRSGARSLILLSDGGDTVAPDRAAALARTESALRAAAVRTEVVGFRTDEDDTAALRRIAAASGGRVHEVRDAAGVTSAFLAAATGVDDEVRWRALLAEPASPGSPIRLDAVLDGRAVRAAGALPAAAPAPAAAAAGAGTGAQATAGPPAGTAPGASTSKPSVSAGGASARATGALGQAHGIPLTVLVALALCTLGLAGAAFAALAPAPTRSRPDVLARLDQHVRAPQADPADRKATGSAALSEQLIGLGEKVMRERSSTARTLELLERADLPWRAGEWFALKVVSALVLTIGGALLFAGPLVVFGGLLGLLAGLVGPGLVLRLLAKRRSAKFDELLPDVLMLVATSLSSGFSLPQALDAVARDAAEPAAKEFSRALAETRIGAEVADTLEAMATRMASVNMRWAVMAIRIQREVGGNLAESLRTTTKTLRERQKLTRQVKALSAEGRLSAYILIAMPIGLLLYTIKVNYDYVSLLWTTTYGLMLSAVGVVSMAVGIVWMRKTVRIEV